eukprot:GHVL01003560.1.p1 GENE.GHVL01003560.1~~GHVL01003560.1.p1  ORF type:complete len:124 (-),score=19.54 GHVL01003560.1:52-423(-)
MGTNSSRTAEISKELIREPGEFINTRKYDPVFQQVISSSGVEKPRRISVCRCWKSNKFPLCDNTHQLLQRQNIQVGPVMLEARKFVKVPQNVRATSMGGGGKLIPMGAAIAAITGYAHYFHFI